MLRPSRRDRAGGGATARDEEQAPVNSATQGKIVSFIWGIADDILRDLYVRGKYRDVILPFTVLRRLDGVLEPTKAAVLQMKSALDANGDRQPGRGGEVAREPFLFVIPR